MRETDEETVMETATDVETVTDVEYHSHIECQGDSHICRVSQKQSAM